MRGTISPRWLRRPARPVLAAAGTMVVLAGCGSAVAGGAGQPAADAGGTRPAAAAAPSGVPLCSSAGRLDRVMLRLTGIRGREIVPRAATITDPSRVRALATAICTLPRLPGGLRHCPAALSGALLLLFSAQGHAYPPLRIQDSGCPHVTGVGPARQWAWSSRPGRLLSEAVGGKGRLIPGTYPSSVPIQ